MSIPAPEFDPDSPAEAEAGLFGLRTAPEEAGVCVLGVPFDATTSYRRGTAAGPAAILAASHQVDLFDAQQRTWRGGDGRPWAAGIHLEIDREIAAWNEEARPLAAAISERGGRIADSPALLGALERVNEFGARVNGRVLDWTRARLAAGVLPVVLGGDHSVPFGAIQAAGEAQPSLGLLHIDAHADLRPAYEGFVWSHASILHNLARAVPALEKVLSVGLRDVGEVEIAALEASRGRVRAVFGHEWSWARATGADLAALARREVAALPSAVWLTIDVDGLDPTLCPNTGTPVPGGLGWDEALLWLEALTATGKRVVGLDLCEVSPGESAPAEVDSWDAIVGARLLYKAIGAALATNPAKARK
jgi:agmatinase